MATNILDLAASGDARSLMLDMRVRSLYWPYYFIKVVLGYRHMVEHLHHQELEQFVDRWSEGMSKQWIEWPRGFFKTSTFTIGMGIWNVLPCSQEDKDYAVQTLKIPEADWDRRVALHDVNYTQLYAFETLPNAKKKLNEVRNHFEENELFKSLFPEIAFTGKEDPWNDTCLKIRRTDSVLARAEEGTFEAIGVAGALQSRHYHIVWEDDLVGEKARKSETVLNDTIGWHQRLHGAFVSAADQIRFGVSNCWGYSDLNSYVRANEPEFYFHKRSAWETDDSGERIPTFVERYTLKSLDIIQSNMSKYDFNCQYLNDPTPEGDQEYDPACLHIFTIEHGGIKCDCGAFWLPQQCTRIGHYDPFNAKGVRSKSCPAVLTTFLAPDNHVFLVETYAKRGTYDQVYEAIFHQNDKYCWHKFSYEDVAHQNLTEQALKFAQQSEKFRRFHRRLPRIVAVPTRGVEKKLRIRDGLIAWLSADAKLGVRSREHPVVKMLQTFPNDALNHDYDILDALNQGLLIDTSGNKVWSWPQPDELKDQTRSSETEYLSQLGQPYSHVEHATANS